MAFPSYKDPNPALQEALNDKTRTLHQFIEEKENEAVEAMLKKLPHIGTMENPDTLLNAMKLSVCCGNMAVQEQLRRGGVDEASRDVHI